MHAIILDMATEPSAVLKTAADRRQKAVAELETARDQLAAAIRADAKNGVRQVDIVKVTGYTREQVRRIIGKDDDQKD